MCGGLPPGECSACTTRDVRTHGRRRESTAARVRTLRTPPPESLPLDDLLATLPTLAADAVRAEIRLRERVDLLRDRRATWAEIGASLGVTRQAAWERFGRRASRAG